VGSNSITSGSDPGLPIESVLTSDTYPTNETADEVTMNRSSANRNGQLLGLIEGLKYAIMLRYAI